MGFLKSIGIFILDFIETIVIALAFFVLIYFFIMQPHQVKGSSMYPNFHDNDYLLTEKVSYYLNEPERGDVVVFKSPINNEQDYIKRIIAVPKDIIKISQGKIYLNNQELKEPYLPNNTYTLPGSFLTENKEIEVPENSYIVIGDNRNHSSDSREWGFVKKENIIGRSFFRYWPVNKLGLIENVKIETVN